MSRMLVVLANVFFSTLNGTIRLFGGAAVSNVSVEELRSLLSQPNVVLVDVREPMEREVSVIPGAVLKEQFEATCEQYRDKQVVAYCTVGGRSFLYARALCKKGFNAANFKPGIIGWCEADGDLVTLDGESTRRVHVYSSAFKVPERYEAVTGFH